MLNVDKLARLRKEKSISRKEIASALRIDRTTYGKYELGQRQPSLEVLVELANFFNVTTDYLLGRTDNPKTPELAIADELKSILELFHRVGLKGLTQNEIDKLSEYVSFIKSQRKDN